MIKVHNNFIFPFDFGLEYE